jgi:hypothetical protein
VDGDALSHDPDWAGLEQPPSLGPDHWDLGARSSYCLSGNLSCPGSGHSPVLPACSLLSELILSNPPPLGAWLLRLPALLSSGWMAHPTSDSKDEKALVRRDSTAGVGRCSLTNPPHYGSRHFSFPFSTCSFSRLWVTEVSMCPEDMASG